MYTDLVRKKAVIRGKYTLKGIPAETAEKITSILKKYGTDTKITKSGQLQEVPAIRHKVPAVGMILGGTVCSVAAFGAFIDIGPGPLQYGLLHRRFFPSCVSPEQAVQVGDHFPVRVVNTDFNRIYFGLPKKWTPDFSADAESHANLSLDEMKLSERTVFRLKRAGIHTLEDLLPYYHVLKNCLMMKIQNLSLDEMDLTVRTYNCLKRAGVNNVGDLFRKYPAPESLQKVRNLGRTSSEELIQKLNSRGISYPGKEES